METVFTVAESQVGQRIDAVAAEMSGLTRSKLQKNGQFLRENAGNFSAFPGKTKVNTDETWKIICAENEDISASLTPWDYSLKVLAETDSWVAIEKPINISVHPSASEAGQETIVNALLHQFGKNLAKKTGRPGIVHRLDKVTSGVLLVAKTDQALAKLQANWDKAEKTYSAIVQGTPPEGGKIEGGIARDPKNRQRMTVVDNDNSKEATTLFTREKSAKNLALLRINIPTGRTHQIRAHLSAIGFPILGDTKYGGQESERVFLHATELSFPDPDTKKMVTVSSELPKNFDIF